MPTTCTHTHLPTCTPCTHYTPHPPTRTRTTTLTEHTRTPFGRRVACLRRARSCNKTRAPAGGWNGICTGRTMGLPPRRNDRLVVGGRAILSSYSTFSFLQYSGPAEPPVARMDRRQLSLDEPGDWTQDRRAVGRRALATPLPPGFKRTLPPALPAWRWLACHYTPLHTHTHTAFTLLLLIPATALHAPQTTGACCAAATLALPQHAFYFPALTFAGRRCHYLPVGQMWTWWLMAAALLSTALAWRCGAKAATTIHHAPLHTHAHYLPVVAHLCLPVSLQLLLQFYLPSASSGRAVHDSCLAWFLPTCLHSSIACSG